AALARAQTLVALGVTTAFGRGGVGLGHLEAGARGAVQRRRRDDGLTRWWCFDAEIADPANGLAAARASEHERDRHEQDGYGSVHEMGSIFLSRIARVKPRRRAC